MAPTGKTPISTVHFGASSFRGLIFVMMTAVVMVLFPLPGWSHDGTAIDIGFKEMVGFIRVKGDVLTFVWEDGDEVAEVVHRLYFQPENIAPTHVPMSNELKGTLIHEVAATDTANAFEWVLSDVPTGVYSLYAVTTEPDICQHVEFAPTSVIVHHPGDPVPFGVMITHPLETNIVAEEGAAIEVRAVSATPPLVSLKAGRMKLITEEKREGEPLCDPFRQQWNFAYDVAEKVVMEPDSDAGPNRWRATINWDTRAVVNEFYAIRAELTDADGQQALGWSHRFVAALYIPSSVADDPPTDDVQEPLADADGLDTTGSSFDTDTAPEPTASPAGCGSIGYPAPPILLVCLLLGGWLLRRRSTRRS
jgi:uncharacterized protein (TIGR03382 family)